MNKEILYKNKDFVILKEDNFIIINKTRLFDNKDFISLLLNEKEINILKRVLKWLIINL